jgi:hypothetical protein
MQMLLLCGEPKIMGLSGRGRNRLLRVRVFRYGILRRARMSLDDEIIDTPDGPMTWRQWKKKHPVQIPSRRTKGKDLPVKVKRFTDPK